MLHSLPAADTALSKLDYPSIVVNYFIISIVMNNFGFLYKLQFDRMVHSDNNVKKTKLFITIEMVDLKSRPRHAKASLVALNVHRNKILCKLVSDCLVIKL